MGMMSLTDEILLPTNLMLATGCMGEVGFPEASEGMRKNKNGKPDCFVIMTAAMHPFEEPLIASIMNYELCN